MQICVQARLGTCWLWSGCFFMCSSSMQRKTRMQICVQARVPDMLVWWHEIHQFFASVSGMWVCGSDGHGVVGECVGEIHQLVESFVVWSCAVAPGRFAGLGPPVPDACVSCLRVCAERCWPMLQSVERV